MALTLAPGSNVARVGHYELRQCLGEGGYGQVYEAWDHLLYRSVALKRLTLAGRDADGSKLLGEARLAASLQHRAFVRIFGYEDHGQAQYIVMELVRGQALGQHAAEFTAEPERVLDIVDQVAAAMAEAHASGLVHGDLKPNNLMLETDGTVRILDFGLARQIDPLATQSGTTEDPQGTIAYMAPERLSGRPTCTASDIYSLGVVLYQLMTGTRPFASLHGLALASAHLHSNARQWEYPATLAPGLLQLILAMTARDPAVRLASMHAVRERIAAMRGISATAVTQASGFSMPAAARVPQPKHGKHRRWPLLLAGAVLLATSVFGLTKLPPSWPIPLASDAALMRSGMEALRHTDRDGAIEQALQSFGTILARSPGHAAAAAGQSLAYSLRYVGDGRDESWLLRAATAARLALQENDQLALAHAAQSWVATLEGHGSEALDAANRALELDPEDIAALHAKINLLLRMQQHTTAQELIRQAQSHWPNERIFADLEGTLHFQQGDYVHAEQAFRRSLRLEPDAVLGYANLSATLLRLGRSDDALVVLQQGLRMQPSGVLYSNLGAVLFARGNFLGASTAFEHAVSAAKGGPNDYLKWANLADALRWIPGREKAARDAYRRATQLLQPILARAPDDATYLTRMGLYAAHLGNKSDALQWTERGAAAAPSNPDVRFRAALANELSGRRSAALAHLERATVLGYPFSSIESEPELVALRRDTRYQTLAMEYKR
ncbi:protein kinase domain-containing protein [Janthinobacterium sp. RB2R34]|uniref:protein kinase domain-containing protein n=1 Tax=Janthinobacterium sp. RB2R34 TaxID=3424193 RepID=UPI003F27BB91